VACGCAGVVGGVGGGGGAVCRVPGRRRARVTPLQQAEAAMLVACGPRGPQTQGTGPRGHRAQKTGERGTWADWTKRHGGVRVRWLGLRWAGVPMPVRWCLDLHGVRGEALEGCGCVVALKVLWVRLRRRIRREMANGQMANKKSGRQERNAIASRTAT